MDGAPCRSLRAQPCSSPNDRDNIWRSFTPIPRSMDRPPAQLDIQRFFAVTAPTVHQMVLILERRGLLRRTPGQPRSLEILVAPEDLPVLR